MSTYLAYLCITHPERNFGLLAKTHHIALIFFNIHGQLKQQDPCIPVKNTDVEEIGGCRRILEKLGKLLALTVEIVHIDGALLVTLALDLLGCLKIPLYDVLLIVRPLIYSGQYCFNQVTLDFVIISLHCLLKNVSKPVIDVV